MYADEVQLKNFGSANAVPHRESRIYSPGTEPIGEVVKTKEENSGGFEGIIQIWGGFYSLRI